MSTVWGGHDFEGVEADDDGAEGAAEGGGGAAAAPGGMFDKN